ncbi:serine hydrolase domain-containing protein [Proteiniclasticum sp.]|uniref:serine hydrolase domain-containing protein n=1 Tax=Proteiniclasticum sp. TaxID=2053595 RepID=UPI0028A2349F|nr:serine hydrolase domain-containing protein [Proteiniclasticum sp.]
MKKKRSRKMMIRIILVLSVVAAAGFSGYLVYATHKLNQLSEMTFEDMIEFTTKDNKDAVITVGILEGERMSFKVYGENGILLPEENHIYEIGSVTKTFTTSLIRKAESEGLIGIDDSIDVYLDLHKQDHYPTVKELMTHTAGYKGEYFEKPMISNFFRKANSFHHITGEMVRDRIEKVELKDSVHPFKYSNFGMAVLGQVLEEAYDESYKDLMNDYIGNDLKLSHTRISEGVGDLGSYWVWSKEDAYQPAGAILSDITDMMNYAKFHMEEEPEYVRSSHMPLADVKNSSKTHEKMGIFMNQVASGWMIDNVNGMIWHNGGTRDYNSYIGIDSKRGISVVVLSNLSPDYRIPATVMGIELMKSMQQ